MLSMSAGRVLVYGGRGALGSTVVSVFKQASYWVLNIDLKESDQADHNIIVSGDTWTQQVKILLFVKTNKIIFKYCL